MKLILILISLRMDTHTETKQIITLFVVRYITFLFSTPLSYGLVGIGMEKMNVYGYAVEQM